MMSSMSAELVIQIMRSEAAAIVAAADGIARDQLECAVALLAGCERKIVVTGMGKSGIVAQKLVATLRSGGIPAVFLHPSEAPHGDLGVIEQGDIGVILSHSGESEEIVAILPHLRARNVKAIVITANSKSTVARYADVVLNTSVISEACPLGLAPSSSTAVAMALGDGLALTVMKQKGTDKERFARNHPSGRLGRRLTVRVADLMHYGDANPTVAQEARLTEIIEGLCAGALGAVNVIDNDSTLLGIITDGDIRRALQRWPVVSLPGLDAKQLMTSRPVTARDSDLAADALELMENRKSQISVLPVLSEKTGKCVGLLRIHDIVRAGVV
jgi:arabinose-5-phosphate isomerase